jgi:hypothetical protein
MDMAVAEELFTLGGVALGAISSLLVTSLNARRQGKPDPGGEI